jgi:hypothetical protein
VAQEARGDPTHVADGGASSSTRVTARGWEIYPRGLYEILNWLYQDYNFPDLLVTENGVAESSLRRYAEVLRNWRFLLGSLSIGFESLARYGLIIWLPVHLMGLAYKEQPAGVWIGIVLMVLAVAILIGGLFLSFGSLVKEDAVFEADGQPHRVELPAGEERGLYLRERDRAQCTAVDADGDQIQFRGLGASSYNVNDWHAVNRFDTGAGDVTFTCESPDAGTEVRVGAVPDVATMVGAFFLSCGLSVLLGITGLVLLIVTLVRRRKRS